MNPLCKPSGKTACQPLLIGSHVGMSGTSMMDGSVQEALSYGANTFMLYTGAPQNTRRKPVDELCIPQAQERMRQNNITRFVVHAPYIINLANTVKPEVFSLAVEFLARKLSGQKRWAATCSSCIPVPTSAQERMLESIRSSKA